MEILKAYPETIANDKKMLYILTMGKSISLKDAKDTPIKVVAYALYKDVNKKDEEHEVLVIFDGEHTYSTISKTFKDSFFAICRLMGDDDFSVKVAHGMTKSDRPYIDCELSLE